MSGRGRLGLLGCAMLLALPCRAQQPPAARLVLNHMYFVLDSATWHDVSVSPFLHEQFAAAENRTTTSGDLRWTGSYLYGRHTYLEFLGPGGLPGSQVGDAGFGLGVEHAGELSRIVERYRTNGYAFDTLTRVRPIGADTIPWFIAWRPSGDGALSDRTAMWVMEYTREMAARAAVRDSLPLDNRARSRFLPIPWDSSRILLDAVAATVAVEVTDIAKIRVALQRLGATAAAEGEGAVIDLNGFALRLVPAFGRAGVRRIEFQLNREVIANPTFRFGGRSRLKFGPGRMAVWEFN